MRSSWRTEPGAVPATARRHLTDGAGVRTPPLLDALLAATISPPENKIQIN